MKVKSKTCSEGCRQWRGSGSKIKGGGSRLKRFLILWSGNVESDPDLEKGVNTR